MTKLLMMCSSSTNNIILVHRVSRDTKKKYYKVSANAAAIGEN